MPSDNQRFSYLQNILRDGITPFHYRNRVRTLLGMPERDLATIGHHHSSRSVPVGFKYRQQEPLFMDTSGVHGTEGKKPTFWIGVKNEMAQQKPAYPKSLPDQDPHLTHKHSETDNVLTQKLNSLAPKETQKPQPLGSQENSITPYTLAPKKPDSSPTLKLADNDESNQLSQSKSPQHVEPAITQRSRIEIPGRSPAIKTFPLLSDLQAEDNTQNRKIEMSPSLKEQPTKKQNTLPIDAPDQDTLLSSRGWIQRKSLTSDVKTLPPQTSEVSPDTNADPRQLRKPTGFNTKATKPIFKNDSNHFVGIKSTSNKAMSFQIEKLQHAVQELTVKKNRSRPSDESEPQPQKTTPPPTPPQKPVVVVQQTPRRFRTPDAFWERSHMGRMHLRLLR